MALKYLTPTEEMISRIQENMPGCQHVQEAVFSMWADTTFVMDNFVGHKMGISNLVSFEFSIPKAHYLIKNMEKKLDCELKRKTKILKKLEEKGNKKPEESKFFLTSEYTLMQITTRIILIVATIKDYEKNVIHNASKNKKTIHWQVINPVLSRIEMVYNTPIEKIPVFFEHTLQKIYMRKLSKQGFLPNPIFDIKKMPHKIVKYQYKKM